MTKLLVLDFDGTMTDAEKEGAPFRQGYLEDIAQIAGIPLAEVLSLAAQIEAEVAASPQDHGWLFGGRIVAPATVDPYLRVMPVARRILQQARVQMDEGTTSRLLEGILYKYNYQKTLDVPRPGAREALSALEGTSVYVVTNSDTAAVQRKIRKLSAETPTGHQLDWLIERVHGRAQKYVIDDAFTEVAESISLPGLSRPILLRRRRYYEALDALRRKEGASWEELVVVGDIFELDLALPLALGARVALLRNDFTPSWEIDYLREHPRAKVLSSISEIPALIR